MKKQRQWVLYALHKLPDGRTDKIPINARTLGKAQSNNQSTWTDFETACKSLDHNADGKAHGGVISGLGFMLTGSGIVCIDLDHIGDELQAYREGQQQGKVWDFMNRTAGKAYAEISQSGEGIHIFAAGTLPAGSRKHDGVEMYEKGRFIAMTGNIVDDTHTNILDDCTPTLKELHREYLTVKKQKPKSSTSNAAPLPLHDVDIQKALDTAKRTSPKFAALYAGDTSPYNGDESRADQALCDILAFYLHNDTEKIDTAFRSSRLMRDKWDRKTGGTTYGAMTIQKAIEDTHEFFDYSQRAKKDFQPPKKAGDGSTSIKAPTISQDTKYPDISGSTYSCTKDGEIKSKDYNYQLYLLDNHLLDDVYYDEFSYSFVQGTEYVNDDFFRTLYGEAVQANIFSGSINEKQFTAQCEFLVKKYHTINLAKQYFDGLIWDNKPRLEKLLSDLYGVDDNALSREALKIWLIAAVKRVYSKNPVQFDYILMLEGGQGTGKTSFFNALGLHGTEGRNFCNSLEKKYINDTRSFALNMLGKLICYDGDLKVLKDIKNTDIKNFITRTSDTFDNKYDKHQTTIHRQFVIGADTNETAILNDVTGNRRYIILHISKCCEYFHSANWRKALECSYMTTDSSGNPYSGEQLVNQIWAEAVHLYKNDPERRLELSDTAKEIQTAANELYSDTGIEPFYDEIIRLAEQIYNEQGSANITEIRKYVNGEGEILYNFSGREQIAIISKCLEKAGYERRTKSVKGKKIKVRVPADIPTNMLPLTPEEREALIKSF